MSASAERLPAPVRRFLARSLPQDGAVPAVVRVRQTGHMWKKPGARAMRFGALEKFAVDRVAFRWHARFPIAGPLAMTVIDELDRDEGRLRVSLLGLPLQIQQGPEINLGQAMRYLAELAWAPQAIAANQELAWKEIDERTVEVSTAEASVRWRFDAAGDLVEATGVRPYPQGKSFVPRPWGGDFGDYADHSGIRVPTAGEAWWELPEGRFVYWRGRVTGLELRTI